MLEYIDPLTLILQCKKNTYIPLCYMDKKMRSMKYFIRLPCGLIALADKWRESEFWISKKYLNDAFCWGYVLSYPNSTHREGELRVRSVDSITLVPNGSFCWKNKSQKYTHENRINYWGRYNSDPNYHKYCWYCGIWDDDGCLRKSKAHEDQVARAVRSIPNVVVS